MEKFNQLLSSKYFLLTFIQTLEQQKDFTIMDKARVASLLMVVLMDDMVYATDVIQVLLSRLIDKSMEKKTHKTMLRRTESIVEKLLAHWLSLCMYNQLRYGTTGRTLFRLYQAIKRQTEKGPVDAVTGEARYSMTEDRLLREKVDHSVLTVSVQCGDFHVSCASPSTPNVLPAYPSLGLPPLPANVHPLVQDCEPMWTCKLLDCDTISQAKAKILEVLYANVPFTQRPTVHNIDLLWKSGKHGRLPLCDEDVTTRAVNGWKQINTLSHYHIQENAIFIVVDNTRRALHDELPSNGSPTVQRNANGSLELDPGVCTLRPIRLADTSSDRVWHIVKQEDIMTSHGNSRSPKVISEIFLTRILSTKMTLQSFIDDFFESMLHVDNSLRLPVKYLFDIFDSVAMNHGITDPEVVHAWKCNSLPLRFWVNVIQNPEFLFDIDKSTVVESCLSAVAQTLMDSCSTHEHHLGKDSPSTKLLFAKDIPRYRDLVTQFYTDIQQMAPLVADDEMKRFMTCVSKMNATNFKQQSALEQLYQFASKYHTEVVRALESDASCQSLRLATRFHNIDVTNTPPPHPDDVTDDVTVTSDVLLSFV